ncbi:C6 zinc finger domain-containing protein [Alternaria rosae]|uniref:C6 zinc finger domain-containing protein n=1 Tax=Alternaria rosae TaxID=1187941 RepID=UPI001E8DDDC8|nr:C6 zinc finger domain-containing protein [Alternaria rosae]KAH6878035.1 C6 zinc finger domain-containing protein [Alternaria rosae]
MPTLAQDKVLARDLKAKKTKSRNGCGRCKLKRLKCDETAPGCLQCKKRNVACPGYEKTLKWSTKYEVFNPTQSKSASPRPRSTPDATSTTSPAAKSPLPQNVASGIEAALAAVLPAGRKNSPPTQQPLTTQASSAVPSPPSFEEPASIQESSTEDGDSPREYEPFPMEDVNTMDPIMLDGFVDAIQMPNEDFSFDPFDNIDFDSGSLEDLTFDMHDLSQKQDMTSSSLPVMDREQTRESSPRLSRSLLLDLYRLPSPSPDPSSPDDVESLLVQHYFKDVCAVFSSFDSVLNPFRTTIGRIYKDCPSINYAIQSMAAAHLANTFPNMAATGLELQRKAREALELELPLAQRDHTSATKTFLSIMLLGLTTSWHDSNALGLEYLSIARDLILPKLFSRSGGIEVEREAQFFEESLIHWEMLMGFVTEDAMSFSPKSGLRPSIAARTNTPAARGPQGKTVPHPWTGIAPMIHFLFAEVGRLVRKERSMDRENSMDLRRRQENLQNAASLEEDLLAVDYPSVDQVIDTGDERTPKEHFVTIAEAYRLSGLLEIYRVFPSILRKRLSSGKTKGSENIEFAFPTPRFETVYEATDIKLWLNSLAMHIIRSLESLPSSSGTFCIQPLLLVVTASELKFVSSIDFFDVQANDAEVVAAREFVIRRLQEFALRLPNKPLRKMIQLIKETWRQSDEGQDAFWIDVMNDKGYHTIM